MEEVLKQAEEARRTADRALEKRIDDWMAYIYGEPNSYYLGIQIPNIKRESFLLHVGCNGTTSELVSPLPAHRCDYAEPVGLLKVQRHARLYFRSTSMPCIQKYTERMNRWQTSDENEYDSDDSARYSCMLEYQVENMGGEANEWDHHSRKINLCPFECPMCVWKVLSGVMCRRQSRSCAISALPPKCNELCMRYLSQNLCCLQNCCSGCIPVLHLVGMPGLRGKAERCGSLDRGAQYCYWKTSIYDEFVPTSMFAWGYCNGVYTFSDITARLVELNLVDRVIEACSHGAGCNPFIF